MKRKILFKTITIGSALATTVATVALSSACGSSSASVQIGGSFESRSIRTTAQWQADFSKYDWSKTAIVNKKVQPEAFSSTKNNGKPMVLPSNFYLPDDVTEIGNLAFFEAEFTGPTSLPYNLEVIDRQAFQKAKLPDGFAVPRDLKSIGLKAFGDLEIPDGFLLDPFSKTIVLNENAFVGSSIKNYGTNAAPQWSKISLTTYLALKIGGIHLGQKTITNGDGTTTTIDTAIAKDYRSGGIIKDWTYPNKLSDIPKNAFENADFSSLVNGKPVFVIPKWIKNVRFAAFIGAKLPEGFTIPSNVVSIEYQGFGNLIIPTGFNVVWENSVPIFDSNAFGGSKFDDATGAIKMITKKTYDSLDGTGISDLNRADGKTRIRPQSIYQIKDGNVTNVLDETMVSNGKLANFAFENFDFSTPDGQAELDRILSEPAIKEIGTRSFQNAVFKYTAKNQKFIADTVEKIGFNAFDNATFINDFNIPSTLKTINESAFNGIKLVKDATSGTIANVIYDSTLAIPSSAFSQVSVYTPAQGGGYTQISDAAPIKFGTHAMAGLEEIGSSAFERATYDATLVTALNQLTNLKSIRKSAFDNVVFKSKFTLGSSLTKLVSLDGEIFASATFEQGADFTGSAIQEFGDFAFSKSKWGTTSSKALIVLPANLKYVATGMFQGVDFSNATLQLPTTVTTIRNSAFSDAVLNSDFNLSDLTNLTIIGESAFGANGDNQEKNIKADYHDISKFKVPSSVTSIGMSAFQNAILPSGFTLGNLQWKDVTLGGGMFFGSEIPTGFALPSGVDKDGQKMLPGGIFKKAIFEGDDIGNFTDVTHILAEAFLLARFNSNATFTLANNHLLHYIGVSAFLSAVVPRGFSIPTEINYNEILYQAFLQTSINTNVVASTDPNDVDGNGRPNKIYTDVPVKWGKVANDPESAIGTTGNPLPGAVAWIP